MFCSCVGKSLMRDKRRLQLIVENSFDTNASKS